MILSDLVALSFTQSGFGQIMVKDIVCNAETVGLYEKYELQFEIINAVYDNPFNPNQIDVSSTFVSPESDTIKTWGFWDGYHWKIRFAPVSTGVWQFYITVQDSVSFYSTAYDSMNVISSSNPGFIGISEVNRHYLEYSNGEWFYGNGLAKPWFIFEHTPSLFQDMEEHGMNSLVVWMPSWESLLVRDYYDKYDLGRTIIIENVVEAAEAHGIQLIFTIWNHDELRGEGHPWTVRPYYDAYNAFRHIAFPADSFFVNDSSWYYQKNLYRYIIARWGYSASIGTWAVISELDGTGSSSYSRSNPNDFRNIWFERITNYFKENDPYKRPTTGSLAAAVIWDLGFNITDIPQVHFYNYWKSDPLADGTWTMAGMQRQIWEGWNKPAFFGEFGPKDENDLEPEYQHNAIWVCLMNGAALSPMDWNDDAEWGKFTPEMFDDMLNLKRFISDVDLRDADVEFMSVSTSNNKLKAWGIQNKDFGMCWLWDKETTGSIIPEGAIIISLANIDQDSGSYKGYWYDTWQGTYIDSFLFLINGAESKLSFEFPSFTNDLAFKYMLEPLQPEDTTLAEEGTLFKPDPYPNPFKDTVKISLTSVLNKSVRVVIYDILGRKIVEFPERVPSYSNVYYEWDGRNSNGKKVGNGIYFCWAEVGNKSGVKKILLMK